MINILVIEKEKRLCNIICSFLDGYGYKTEQCREPDNAYSLIENNN